MELHAVEIAARDRPRRTRRRDRCWPACSRPPARRSCARNRPASSSPSRPASGCRAATSSGSSPCAARACRALRRSGAPAGNQAEAFGVALLRMLEQQLHAEADAEHRLASARAARRPDPARAAAPCRGRPRRRRAGSPCRRARIVAASRGQRGVHAQPLQAHSAPSRYWCRRHRRDDRRVIHSTPLVLGSSLPSRAIAWRSVRPTTLKQASIMWCALSPRTRQVQVRAQRVAQRAEEMRHQFGRHVADALAREAAFEHEVRAAGQIERGAGLRLRPSAA